MNEKERNTKVAVASIRLAIIQPAFNHTYPDMTKRAYYERISEQPVKLPDGREVIYSPGTMSCWESDYRKGGFDALMPRDRADRGKSRRLDADAISAIYKAREQFPRLTATGIREKLIADGVIRACDASVATFQRFIKKQNLKGASAPGQRDRKAFEEEFCTGMYQGDTLYGPFIKENGVRRQTYCIMLLDDKSRMIVGGRFFYQDNAVNFQQVFRDACATYGIPAKLYVDNGSPYKNVQLSLICGQLGTVLIHTPVRDGASKGKVERNFRTLRTRFLDRISRDSLNSITELNRMLADYIRSHNTAIHSATGEPPHTRYLRDLAHVRMPQSRQWLEDCFLHRVSRKVRNDATIILDRTPYDVPMEFIRSTVEVRYQPGDEKHAFLLYDGKRYPISPTNKTENSKVCRKQNYYVNYGGEGEV